MNRTLFSWVAAALLALCGGLDALCEGNCLPPPGYHLCLHNETKMVTFMVIHKVSYNVTKPCGDWLLWKTCTVTLYKITPEIKSKMVTQQVTKCCDGFVQVGRYCALPVNRSGELVSKPGSCPATDGLYPGSEACESDMDCPGWQKCCQTQGRFLCHPASPANDSENGGCRLNATVTVKVDYQLLKSKDKGLLNHTRILQAMVTGALQSDDISVSHLSSWPVHPYRTATSLLIGCNFTLPLHNITARLHLLLKHIQEVSSVTVEDVDECVEPAFPRCSPNADCNNTVGSYHCTCHQGYADGDPSNPGCTGGDSVWSSTAQTLLTHAPSMNTTYSPVSNTTQDPRTISTTGFTFTSSEISMTTALSNTSSVPHHSSQALQSTSPAPHTSMSSTVLLPLLTTTCSPPSITTLMSSNVTGTSFCVHWSSHSEPNQTYWVVVRNRSEVIYRWETDQTIIVVRGLQPGLLYDVSVTPRACGSNGATLLISVRTDSQTLDATARLTNIPFTDDLLNSSSQAYKNLTASIIAEIYQSLSPEIKALVDANLVTIEITSYSPGSVVVNFTLTFSTNQSYDISNVSNALLSSLMNSSIYTVDNATVTDFNECASSDLNDCSQWATCTNKWGTYDCVCKDGYIDENPERPGRACQANSTSQTTTASPAPTIFSTASTTAFSVMPPSTGDPGLTTVTITPETATSEMVSTAVTPSSLVSATSSVTAFPNTDSLATTTPATTTSISATTTHVLTPTSVAMATTTTVPSTTNAAPTTTTASPTTTTVALTTTTAAPTTTTAAPTTTTAAPTTTTAAPTTTTAAPTTTTAAPTTTTAAPTTTTAAPTTTTAAPTTTTAAPTTTTAAPTTTTTTTTLTLATTTATTSTALRMSYNPGAISLQCRIAAITVTVDKDFLLNAKIRESDLYLGSQECGINGGNSTYAQLTVAWDECAVRLVHNATHYTVSVNLLNNMDPYISSTGTVEVPRVKLEVPITCTYTRSTLISADSSSIGYDLINDVIMGLGSFQVTVQLMNGTLPLPQNYSLSPEDSVVLEVSLNISFEQIKVVINKCWATPTLNPADTFSYTFLENSCSLNRYTSVLTNGNSSTSRVSVQIFSFIDLRVIYLHCQVYICVPMGSDTCVPDCLQRKTRTSKSLGTGLGSVGPLLRLYEVSLDQELSMVQIIGFSCLGVGLSIFFIVAFICLFFYQRNRIGHYNFNTKPKQENFTYLVFNT